MPASTLEPVSEALRSALGRSNEGEGRDLGAQLAGSTKKALLANIDFEPAGSYQSTVLDVLKSKYIVLKSSENVQQLNSTTNNQENDHLSKEETLSKPKKELYPLESIQLGWSHTPNNWSVGAGMVNMGNTCYLNSTLQALFHVPSLINWLMSDKEHSLQCLDTTICIICAMRKTLQDTQQRNIGTIRPVLVYSKLRMVCRNLIPGRQEDAHEFLRYLVEAMEKNYIQRFKNYMEFDSKVKETTPLNQILGGYLRSAVRCLRCSHVSTTFQHFQDLLLDIRKAQTLSEALELYFSQEKLDDDSYHCEACQKKVPATKQFSLERAPMVLCIQLKRFSVSNNKLTKHIAFKQRLDLTSYSKQKLGCQLIYKLVALVTHMGPTVSCGHYTAVAMAPSGNFYLFDDSMVRQISQQNVFNTNAYIMLYELENNPYSQKFSTKYRVSSTITEPVKVSAGSSSGSIPLPGPSSSKSPGPSTSKLTNNGIGFTSDKVYGPELPPDRVNGGLSVSSTATKEHKEKIVSSSSKADDSSASSDLSEEENISKSASPAALVTKEADSSTANDVDTVEAESEEASPSSTSKTSPSSTSTTVHSSPSKTQSTSKTTTSPKKNGSSPSKSLVPYDTGDTSGSEDSNHSDEKVSTQATAGEWQVTSSTDVTPHREAANSEGVKTKATELSNGNNGNVVSELYKMSNSGYSAQVFTWNGTKTQLDKEVSNEKREDRKRHLTADSSIDQGRTKHPKVSSSQYHGKSNPGYNPVQEYHNMKNWNHHQNGNSSGNHQHFKYFNSGNRHRRNFHHKGGGGGGNYHKSNGNNNNYRFR